MPYVECATAKVRDGDCEGVRQLGSGVEAGGPKGRGAALLAMAAALLCEATPVRAAAPAPARSPWRSSSRWPSCRSAPSASFQEEFLGFPAGLRRADRRWRGRASDSPPQATAVSELLGLPEEQITGDRGHRLSLSTAGRGNRRRTSVGSQPTAREGRSAGPRPRRHSRKRSSGSAGHVQQAHRRAQRCAGHRGVGPCDRRRSAGHRVRRHAESCAVPGAVEVAIEGTTTSAELAARNIAREQPEDSRQAQPVRQRSSWKSSSRPAACPCAPGSPSPRKARPLPCGSTRWRSTSPCTSRRRRPGRRSTKRSSNRSNDGVPRANSTQALRACRRQWRPAARCRALAHVESASQE